jgi:[ribosomal protein S5]-alanine N-acetyltransferase
MHTGLPVPRHGSTFLKDQMIDTERLILRPFKKDDYRDYHEYMSVPETYRFERGAPITVKEAKKFCKEWASRKTVNFWAVELKETGRVIGNVSFFPEGPPDFRTWSIGYIFNPLYHNKGYATEAARGVIRHAFTELKVHRITAGCSPENTPSWKVLEKCGMRREALNLKNFPIRYDENGVPVWLDSYQYAILEDEFKAGVYS